MIKIDKRNELNELRRLRAEECYSIVNRGALWYSCLTNDQLEELRAWYRAWLDVTETRIIPTKPKWLNNKLEPEEILW